MSTPILRRKVNETEYQDFALDQPTCTVGRSSDCDITINDTSLSRLHMRLENRAGTFFVVDNNSSNGTFLNRRKIDEAPLIHGDLVIAGRVQFSFHNEDSEEGSQTRPMPVMDDGMGKTITANLDDMTSGYDDFASSTDTPDQPFQAIPKQAPPAPMAPPPPMAPPEPSHQGATVQLDGDGIYQDAEPLYRLLAFLIDIGVGFALAIPSLIFGMFSHVLSMIFSLLATVAAIIHLVGGWMKYRKTIGKHLLGMHIEYTEDPNGQELPPNVVFMRIIGYIACYCTCGLLFLMVVFDKQRRGLQDKLAKTRVVRRQ